MRKDVQYGTAQTPGAFTDAVLVATQLGHRGGLGGTDLEVGALGDLVVVVACLGLACVARVLQAGQLTVVATVPLGLPGRPAHVHR
jgi:hypothetical protein